MEAKMALRRRLAGTGLQIGEIRFLFRLKAGTVVALLNEATAAVAELEAVYSQTASKLDDLRASACRRDRPPDSVPIR